MGAVTEALGWGIVAGVAGTAAMTLSETIEQKITKRPGSLVPAQVGAKIVEPPIKTGAQAEKLNWVVHWGHGITMGAVRGLLGATALGSLAASILHFPIVWGGDVILYAALGIAPAPWKWRGQDLGVDLFHKFVLSAVTSVVFIALY